MPFCAFDKTKNNPNQNGNHMDRVKVGKNLIPQTCRNHICEDKLNWMSILYSYAECAGVFVMFLVNPIELWMVEESMS